MQENTTISISINFYFSKNDITSRKRMMPLEVLGWEENTGQVH
jgi:hypothetical protein